jgi:ribosome-binding ATPase
VRMQVGIVGLPNVGKSTLFNAITAAGAEAANYPFATIEPNVGVVPLRDPRLDEVARLARSPKVSPTSLEVVDIAGLVRGASRGEGLGNQFLARIREVDAIVHIVRCFDDPDVVHVDGSVDPARDIEVVETELLLKDLETVQRRADRVVRAARAGDQALQAEADLVTALQTHLEAGEPARTFATDPRPTALVRELGLLTAKPVLYVVNIAEGDLPDGNPVYTDAVRRIADKEGAEVVVLAAEAEAQIAELDRAEQAGFLADLGLHQSGLDRLASAAYRLLGLITFFTAGPKEARAWTVRNGTKAPRAAGQVHSDMERGFIRAETVSYDDYAACGGEQGAREAGKLRSEGKDYVVRDGDVILFRFNV